MQTTLTFLAGEGMVGGGGTAASKRKFWLPPQIPRLFCGLPHGTAGQRMGPCFPFWPGSEVMGPSPHGDHEGPGTHMLLTWTSPLKAGPSLAASCLALTEEARRLAAAHSIPLPQVSLGAPG